MPHPISGIDSRRPLQGGTIPPPTTGGMPTGEGQEGSTGAKIDAQNIDDQVLPGISKSKGKSYCSRCLTKDHVLTDCNTVIRCGMCNSNKHVTKVCPYQKGAKPTAILCGYAVERLGFYYIPFEGKQQSEI